VNNVTATATVMVLLQTAAAQAAPAPSRHRPFWDVSLGPVYSDNVYRDRSAEADIGYGARLRVGVRSRHSKDTFSQVHYDLDALGFPGADVENRAEHAFDGLVRHRFRESLSLEGRAGVRLSRFPAVAVFNSTTAYGQASLKSYLTSRTTLEGGLGYETRSYPDYDLDYGGVGIFATLARDMGRRTFGELSIASRRDDYGERLVHDPSSGSEAGLRADRDWLAGLRVVRDVSLLLQLEAAYQYGRLASNGDALDFGPFQSQLGDFPGDERLVGDYYSHRRHQLGVRFRRLIRRGTSVTLAARYQDRAYSGRLAKDENDEFRIPEQLRHDRAFLIAATAAVPFPLLVRRAPFGHFGLRIRVSHEVNHSNEALYDYGNSVFSVALTSWF
jgi:hypothetical protein